MGLGVAPAALVLVLVLVSARDWRGGDIMMRKREAFSSVLCRPGDDLLSRVLRQSTIGAKAFDGRVRDGIGSDRLARATRPAKDGGSKTGFSIWQAASWSGDRGLQLHRRAVCAAGSHRLWCLDPDDNVALATRAIKSNERLVPVSFTRYRASTSGLSTWWSSTALQGELVLRLASRLDAFSGYPFHI